MIRAAILLILWAGCSRPEEPPDLRIVIFQTGDLHGKVDQLPRIAAFIKGQRAKETGRILLVDSGDFFQGTPEGDFTSGRLVIDAMNEIGYDALCLGNHDFDRGLPALATLATAAKFPFLAANVEKPFIKKSAIFDSNIEVLGLTTLTPPNESAALTSHRWTAPIHLLLTHIGIDRDRLLPTKGVAAILGGHSHSIAAEQLPGGTWLLHSGAQGQHIGRLELVIDSTGRIRHSKATVIDIPDKEDPALRDLIRRGSAEIRKKMDGPVAELKGDLPRGGADLDGVSSPLGNHLCDVMMGATGADLAILLRSGIRSSLFAGTVRERNIYEVSPFPDTLATFEMTGKKLRWALEGAVADEGRLLVEIGGFEFAYDPSADRGKRILRTSLDPARTYRVVTTSFLADGDGMFAGAKSIVDTKRLLLDVHRDFLARHSPFAATYRNRITRAAR